MPPVRTRDLERALQRKGFEGEVRGGHMWYYFTVDGRHTGLHLFRSLRDDDLHEGRIGQMARRMQMSREEFMSVVDCTLDQAGIVALLRSKGVTV